MGVSCLFLSLPLGDFCFRAMNLTEQDEREYLEDIKQRLTFALRRMDDRVKLLATELRQNKEYLYEHQSGMDEADQVAAGQSINRMASTGENAAGRKRKLMKLLASPYFGRIDFGLKGQPNSIYIGIHTFTDDTENLNLIYDWRAPISSMFYDFELGDAWYTTPSGDVRGIISRKRQYKIKDGRFDFMIENDVHIHDDVLQQELSKASDDKMKNIVATIQRDQNAVIRNETAPVMIIQGVAGSGKTSIALHRIAFLLYRFRDEIKANHVLIISPNKVFADYISNVLPELGEEQIPEMGMEELADEVLENQFTFQSFFQQVSSLLQQPDEEQIERIQFKSTFEFLSKLNQYVVHLENNYFSFAELKVGKVIVPFPFILERFKAYYRMPLLKRTPEVARDVQQYVRNIVQRKLTGNEKAQIWQGLEQMHQTRNVLELYKGFYRWLGRPELFQTLSENRLEYADVFPLIYCKMRLEGTPRYDHVKHLLVDEMQDYTPVQYSVLSRLFLCKKTILGDVNQTVNPYSASSAERIEQVFPQGETVKLVRSYRSTIEISSFAQRIAFNPELIPLARHGAWPTIEGFENNVQELDRIKIHIAAFQKTGYPTLGVICKTQDQAEFAFNAIQTVGVSLLTSESTAFKQGVTVTTAHLAKGLEFDEVIIPFASARNYHTELDQRMLYIACTRAMHRLSLTFSGEQSRLITN